MYEMLVEKSRERTNIKPPVFFIVYTHAKSSIRHQGERSSGCRQFGTCRVRPEGVTFKRFDGGGIEIYYLLKRMAERKAQWIYLRLQIVPYSNVLGGQ
jgi:hypothetical protein